MITKFVTFPVTIYISGDQLSVDDVKVYAAVVEKPSDVFHLAKSFPGKTVGVSIGGSAAQAESYVIMEVKPWDGETGMKKLDKAVHSVEMPGLLWRATKMIPVGYGIKKLTIMLTIVDDLVSPDSLIEDYLTCEPNNEYIQSVDIIAFNKI